MNVLCELERYVADGNIRKANILYELEKDNISIRVRALFKLALSEKIDEIIERKEIERSEKRKLDLVAARVVANALFTGEVK